MIIETDFGNFGSFKDLYTYMSLEHKDSVYISKCDYWGINCILGSGRSFSQSEINEILTQK